VSGVPETVRNYSKRPISQQSDGGFKSMRISTGKQVSEVCRKGENADIADMDRIIEHWRDLDHREPTLKTVCREDYSRDVLAFSPTGVRTCPGN